MRPTPILATLFGNRGDGSLGGAVCPVGKEKVSLL